MKITKRQLRQIILEEKQKLAEMYHDLPRHGHGNYTPEERDAYRDYQDDTSEKIDASEAEILELCHEIVEIFERRTGMLDEAIAKRLQAELNNYLSMIDELSG